MTMLNYIPPIHERDRVVMIVEAQVTSTEIDVGPRFSRTPISTMVQAAARQDIFGDPITRDLPEGESFTDDDAATIGHRLMREPSRRPVVEVEAAYGSDL